MLVARICQLYPNAVAGAIVSRFFVIMHQWYMAQLNIGIHMSDEHCQGMITIAPHVKHNVTGDAFSDV